MKKALLTNSHKDLVQALELTEKEKKTTKDKSSGVFTSREPTQDKRETLFLLAQCCVEQGKIGVDGKNRDATNHCAAALKMPWQQNKTHEKLKVDIEELQAQAQAVVQEAAAKAERARAGCHDRARGAATYSPEAQRPSSVPPSEADENDRMSPCKGNASPPKPMRCCR